MRRFQSFLFVLLALAVTRAAAQADCPAIVEQALNTVDTFCQTAGRNQACYGNLALQAEPQPGVRAFRFEQVGDMVNVADLQSLRLSPMDEETGAWGVALMRLQANLPETLPGQNVTFLLFGDVEIVNATLPDDDTHTPMQAFFLRTGIGDAACEEAPDSGLLVQTPEGVGEVGFTVNGVDVAMGSTVFFQSGGESELNIAAVEGAAYTNRGGDRRVILAGTQTRFAPQDLMPAPAAAAPPVSSGSGTPPPVVGQPYDADQLRALPLRLLERRVAIHPPLTRDQVAHARALLASGKAPCGEDPFPACEKLPLAVGGRPCLLLAGQDEATPPPDEGRPLCPTPERPLLGGRRPCPRGQLCPTPTPASGG